ncbi:hypothetical protein HPB52_010511 [Rhipicephalus sanguineus]|uniref:SGS domain-containing protein n=1 Tax=Rhipicephalus sanguineus TaxID=34632 RepID=A0A9D4T236_RHISA|nr:hypothetical protein HPB52_010511 [Rhipicephalus sanguineus]
MFRTSPLDTQLRASPEATGGVVTDVDKAFENGCEKNAKLLLRKGQALFHLDKYDKAKEVLEEGLHLGGSDSDFGVWIEKCSTEIKLLEKAKEAIVAPPAPAKTRSDCCQVLPDQVPEAASVERAPPVFRAKNWDSIVKETENEKEEGDAALNSLFQKIYAEGSDEVKRAMNKSFMESGGTVLSTNWEEIAGKTTPIKPPDGMEYRKWTE